MEASAAPDANLDTTRPAMGRFFCPPVPPACPPISLHSPATSRCLRGLLWSPGGIFALVSSRVEQTSKKQNLRKDHLQALRAVLLSWSVPLYSNTIKLRISAHRTPNRAQSNPGPLRQEQAGALSFVLGQGEDGTMLFIGVPPGAAGAVTTPADILHAGHLAVGLELNHASFQRCGQIGHGG